MLVLSRKVGERIVIPRCEVAITVVSVKGNHVRLGITAPDDVWRQIGRKTSTSPAKG